MTTTACRLGTRFHSLSVLSGDGIPSIAPIEGVDLDSLSDMSETDRAKAMFNQLKQVKAGNVWSMKLRDVFNVFLSIFYWCFARYESRSSRMSGIRYYSRLWSSLSMLRN